MIVFDVRNVGQALPAAMAAAAWQASPRDSRNGPVLVFPSPVTTVYRKPEERVVFWAERDANPFFHFFEGLWMLAGRNDVGYLTKFVKRMKDFSDDGKTFHAAYGHRWRRHFGRDQVDMIIGRLRRDPEDRRSVLQIWSMKDDLDRTSKDLPCNTQAVFQRNVHGHLDMTVYNRSNDLILGAYGANAVHFSMLQEYMARSIGCEMGSYWQVSANFHAYTEHFDRLYRQMQSNPQHTHDPYSDGLKTYPMMSTDQATWDQDLVMFMEEPGCVGFRDHFFRRVAVPMWHAHLAYRTETGLYGCDSALEIIQQCRAEDWRLACTEWLRRRRAERMAKAERAQEAA